MWRHARTQEIESSLRQGHDTSASKLFELSGFYDEEGRKYFLSTATSGGGHDDGDDDDESDSKRRMEFVDKKVKMLRILNFKLF